MITLVITLCLLISSFIIAFAHSAIIYNKHSSSLYANYFTIFNISFFALINAIAYLVYGVDTSKFQGWNYSPAVFQIGIVQLAIFIFSILALFKSNQFKAAMLFFFVIFQGIDSLTIFSTTNIDNYIISIFSVEIITVVIAFIFYKLLIKNK